MAAKIKKGDKVVVLAGRDKGRTRRGAVRVAERRPRDRRGRQPRQAPHQAKTRRTPEGGIITKSAPINLSNLAIADPKDGKPTRVGFKVLDDGRKVRFAKRSGDLIDG